MRLRKPLVLRFHKFKQTTDSHQFYFFQLRSYYPHYTTDLYEWEEDFEKCIAAYNEHKESIEYVKSKEIKYQEKVESAQSQAQEEWLLDHTLTAFVHPSTDIVLWNLGTGVSCMKWCSMNLALTSLLLLGLSYIVPLLLIGVESMSVWCGISSISCLTLALTLQGWVNAL